MAKKRSDCCNPLAKRDEDRCLGCPMRDDDPMNQLLRNASPQKPDAAVKASSSASSAKPHSSKSLWAFLNDDIPRP